MASTPAPDTASTGVPRRSDARAQNGEEKAQSSADSEKIPETMKSGIPIGRSIGIPDFMVSGIFSLSALLWAFSSPFWARASDRRGTPVEAVSGAGVLAMRLGHKAPGGPRQIPPAITRS